MTCAIVYNSKPMDTIIIFSAKYLFLFVVLGLGIAWLRSNKDTKVRFAVATVVAGLVALVLSRIASKLYFDPRPFVTQHVKPLISHVADNGFPSDHALLTMTLTVITYFFSKKMAAGMLLFTLAVGVARILAKVHSPLDIGAGWVIGGIGAIIGYYATRWAFDRYRSRAIQPSTPEE